MIKLGNNAKAIPYYAMFRPNEEPVHFNGVFLTADLLLNRLAEEGVELPENPPEDLDSQAYTKVALQNHLDNGKNVFVHVTADWHATAKFNEQAAIISELTKKTFDKNNIVVLKADKTKADPEIDKLLKQLGSSQYSLPYYALFQPGREPVHFGGVFPSAEKFLSRLAEERMLVGEAPETPEQSIASNNAETQAR